MRTFCISFVLGACLAITVELRAEDESLPLPISTSDATSSYQYPKTSKADMIKASRVQRAKYVAAQHLAIETVNRWSGVNPGRPQINAGYMFLTPPRASYRWYGPMHPSYIISYELPIQ